MFKKLVTVGTVLVATCLILTGCNAKETGKVLIEKSYKVVVNAENVVVKASTPDFITTVKMLEVPMKLIGAALEYVEKYITDPKVKEAFAAAVKGISEINKIIANITPDQVDEAKAKIIGSLDSVKTALKFIGKYFGAEFPPDVAMISSNTDPAKDLDNAVKELEKTLKKIK